MRLSLNTAYICPMGSMEQTLIEFKKAGFDTYDFSSSFIISQCDTYIDKVDYLERAKKLRKFADDLGLVCNQSHSFMKYISKNNSEKENAYLWMMCIRSIEIAGVLGAKYVVIHPFSSYSEEENVMYFKQLAEHARKAHTKIAIENVPEGIFSYEESIISILDKINDEDVRLCIDVGHAELPKIHPTTAPDMIRKCGKYLGCLHIQDNDKFHDSHTLPGLGLLDFDEIVKALKEVNYQGDLTYEADGYVYYSNDDYTLRYKCLPEIYKNGIELLSKFK